MEVVQEVEAPALTDAQEEKLWRLVDAANVAEDGAGSDARWALATELVKTLAETALSQRKLATALGDRAGLSRAMISVYVRAHEFRESGQVQEGWTFGDVAGLLRVPKDHRVGVLVHSEKSGASIRTCAEFSLKEGAGPNRPGQEEPPKSVAERIDLSLTAALDQPVRFITDPESNDHRMLTEGTVYAELALVHALVPRLQRYLAHLEALVESGTAGPSPEDEAGWAEREAEAQRERERMVQAIDDLTNADLDLLVHQLLRDSGAPGPAEPSPEVVQWKEPENGDIRQEPDGTLRVYRLGPVGRMMWMKTNHDGSPIQEPF